METPKALPDGSLWWWPFANEPPPDREDALTATPESLTATTPETVATAAAAQGAISSPPHSPPRARPRIGAGSKKLSACEGRLHLALRPDASDRKPTARLGGGDTPKATPKASPKQAPSSTAGGGNSAMAAASAGHSTPKLAKRMALGSGPQAADGASGTKTAVGGAGCSATSEHLHVHVHVAGGGGHDSGGAARSSGTCTVTASSRFYTPM